MKSSKPASGTIQILKTPLVLQEHATSTQDATDSFTSSQGNAVPLKPVQEPLKLPMLGQAKLNRTQ